MGHCIRGFIGRRDDLRQAADRLPDARVVALSAGFGFLPVTDRLADDAEAATLEDLERLTARLCRWAEEESCLFPLAYVETEYFGGHGWQAAMAWAGGRAVFGPIRTSDLGEGGKRAPIPLKWRAINQAMRHVGVDRGAALDEFEALGLGRHRSNEAWLSETAME
jgi:hypothetical protein